MIPFGRLDARLTASFYRHRSGLSLADRVCLALARSLSSPAYTTDRLWASWAEDLGVTRAGHALTGPGKPPATCKIAAAMADD